MAQDQFSFDIVSEVDLQEVRHAVDQAGASGPTFDFKDTGTSVELQDEKASCTRPPDRLKAACRCCRSVRQAEIPLKSLQAGAIEDAAKAACGIGHDRHRHQRREDQGDLQIRAPGRPHDPDPIQGAQVRCGQEQDDLQQAIARS